MKRKDKAAKTRKTTASQRAPKRNKIAKMLRPTASKRTSLADSMIVLSLFWFVMPIEVHVMLSVGFVLGHL